MPNTASTNSELSRILKHRALTTMFQPLVSVKRKAVFGVEALSRGIAEDGSSLIPPDILFALPESNKELVALDRLCRERALESFSTLHQANKSLLVSINIDAAIINASTARSNHLLDWTRSVGINPNNIIIEIIESKAGDMDLLMDFVSYYKRNGFLIALDDVGAGHSNLDRIPLLKPDLLKLDRSLIKDIDTLFHKQEIVRALKQMASKVGTMVLAEGVETEAEALTCMSLGIEFFQGFLFARPTPANQQDDCELRPMLDTLAADFKTHMMNCISENKHRAERHRSIAELLSNELSDLDASEFSHKFLDFLEHYPTIECVYVLNREGVQISETFCNPTKLKASKRFIYEPARMGTDHSLKDYFLPLKAGLRTYTTEPYIYLASGNRCTTIAAFFRDSTGKKRVLCVDMDCDNY